METATPAPPVVRQINIISRRKKGWVIKKRGNQRATRLFPTKEEAVKNARTYLKKGYDVVVHRNDGSVERWLHARP